MAFLSYLISGLGLGSVYAIIALGYSMVYGIAKMLNFAHGDIIMVGAFVTYYAAVMVCLYLWQYLFLQLRVLYLVWLSKDLPTNHYVKLLHYLY